MADQLNQYPNILSDFSEDELVTNQYTIHTTGHSGSSSHTSLEASNPVTKNSLCIGMSLTQKSPQCHISSNTILIMVIDLLLLRANLKNLYVDVSTTKKVARGVYELLIASGVSIGKLERLTDHTRVYQPCNL